MRRKLEFIDKQNISISQNLLQIINIYQNSGFLNERTTMDNIIQFTVHIRKRGHLKEAYEIE